MKKGTIIAIVCVTAVVVAVVLGVGGYFAVHTYTEHQDKVAAQKAHDRKIARQKAAAKRQREAVATCKREVGPFLQALHTVDSRLDVGVNQETLSDLVGNAAVAKGNVNVSVVTGTCDDAFKSATHALSLYSKTVSEWNDCIFSDYGSECDPDTDLDLQTPWTNAHTYIEDADALVESAGGNA